MTTSHDSPLVILCPGQGAQAVGMCNEWKSASKAAQSVFSQADEILGSVFDGMTITELISNGSKERIDRTDAAQPALFTASIASWKGALELGLIPESKSIPDVSAGLSLGEYTALVISGRMSFEDGLKLVALRGQAMQDAADASSGSMAAILGSDEEGVQEIIEYALRNVKSDEEQVLVGANYNAPGQIVISGSLDAVKVAVEYASVEKKLKAIKLDVAGAFHSPLMLPAAMRLKKALDDVEIQGSEDCLVLSNVTGEIHSKSDSESVKNKLVEQLTNSVRWEKCIGSVSEILKESENSEWIELCPGKTLSGMMRKINRKQKVT
eukprot:CAMPEP_0182442200 /NCGR_PEP_ID=MMETSP1172-20130603/1147_1 /TAXON_ID=708627 /ORGANISM="Timspurckia oligopyrenoides, Strain CCMP3278" /LENGTH=323 /DNA_ID=CAMNT_0024636933 /DNA_START=193 /DNA_END=1160 /DNA_ORIENTATION=+